MLGEPGGGFVLGSEVAFPATGLDFGGCSVVRMGDGLASSTLLPNGADAWAWERGRARALLSADGRICARLEPGEVPSLVELGAECPRPRRMGRLAGTRDP